ncbi:MAG TPA: histidine kinase [Lachnospiraceae bacterium]|nr:histidine kinase [Lachnospiraceae bacterium]
MKRIKAYFFSLKLSRKITLLVLGIIVLPMVLLSTFLFNMIKDSQIAEKRKNIEVSINQNYSQIQKNLELCYLSTQVVINSPSFWAKVVSFNESDKVNTSDLIEFSKSEISAFEKLVISNPYLYQIRVYVDSNKVAEIMPVLYHKSRMERLSWSKDELLAKGSWKFDYLDEIFPEHVMKVTDRLGALVTKVDKEKVGIDAVIEVAIKMNSIFPDIYTSNEKQWTCYVDENGKYHYDDRVDRKWINNSGQIFSVIPKNSAIPYFKKMELNGEPVMVGYMYIGQLNGHILKIYSLQDDINRINTYRNIYFIILLVIVFLLVVLSDRMVKLILKQFYQILDVIRMAKKGDLTVRAADYGDNEMGEMGSQINKMLIRITKLMEDSIKREILVKDSEIRALQNQINAHFIYNSLESIKMMAEIEDKYDISNAVTSLGKLLRYSMRWVSQNVTVEEEVDYIRNYLALINLRFDYEIYLSLNMPEEMWKQEIPKMSLQPIIENAIYHGLEELAEDSSIYMKGYIVDDICTIEITDSGRGMTPEQVDELSKKIAGEIESIGGSGNGIGLKNVQDRIKISFGEEYGISLASKEGCFTKVIVRIPKTC